MTIVAQQPWPTAKLADKLHRPNGVQLSRCGQPWQERAPGARCPGKPFARHRPLGSQAVQPRYGYDPDQRVQSDEVVGFGGVQRQPIDGRDRGDDEIRDGGHTCSRGT